MQCIEDIVRFRITAKKLTVLAYRYQYQIYQLVFTTPSPELVRVSTGDELSME
jgi:predicted kinase